MSLDDHFYGSLSSRLSDYAGSLDAAAKTRYLCKLMWEEDGKRILIPDPYLIENDMWINDPSLWPEVNMFDIVFYLNKAPNGLSPSNIKNLKSLSAYEFVQSGKVETVYLHKLQNIKDMVLMKANIQPSQRLGTENHKPWVLLRENGTVELAHCTCVAGLGETCSHVAALLFKIELGVRLGITKSAPTDEKCAWNCNFTKKSEVLPLEDVSFQKSRGVSPKCKRKSDVLPLQATSPLTDEELCNLKKMKPDAVFFAAIAGSSTDTGSEEVSTELPPTILNILKLYKNKEININVLNSYFSEDNCSRLEKITTKQTESPTWMEHRSGRLTASKFGLVMKRKMWSEKFIISIINQAAIHSSAIKWGLQHEVDAVKAYVEIAKQNHRNFVWRKAGVFIDPNISFLGASPDGMIQCSCCGIGVLEVKCPFTLRTKSPEEMCFLDKNFCLDAKGELKVDHIYHYQVQGQMALTKTRHCDLVIWTPVNTKVVRIRFDAPFWKEDMLPTLQRFYFNYMLQKIRENVRKAI